MLRNEIDLTIHKASNEALQDKIKKSAKEKNPAAGLRDMAAELQSQRVNATVPPSLRRYKTNDTTVEKLGELLRENPNGLLVLRDELVPIIAQHLAKFDKLLPALALILHLVDCAANQQCGPVTEKAALRAAAWCDYL